MEVLRGHISGIAMADAAGDDDEDFIVPAVEWVSGDTGIALPATKEDQQTLLKVLPLLKVGDDTYWGKAGDDIDPSMVAVIAKVEGCLTLGDKQKFVERIATANKRTWPQTDNDGQPIKKPKFIRLIEDVKGGGNLLKFALPLEVIKHLTTVPEGGAVRTVAGTLKLSCEGGPIIQGRPLRCLQPAEQVDAEMENVENVAAAAAVEQPVVAEQPKSANDPENKGDKH